MEDFLSSENLCGQNLLRITARGSAIIAELLRLSDNIPDVFLYHPTNNNSNAKDNNEISKYLPVLFDFQYLREPEEYEKVLLGTIIVKTCIIIYLVYNIYIVYIYCRLMNDIIIYISCIISIHSFIHFMNSIEIK